MNLRFIALLLLIAACATPSLAQRWTLSENLQAPVDSVFSFVERDMPGCALGIYQNGAMTYGRGYGLANLDWRIPISTSTVFDIGSVSKQFTASALVMLHLDGVLTLDDDVRKWVPELPDYGHEITIRHLLNHTSGIRDYLTLMSLAGSDFLDIFDEFDGVELIAKQKALNFDPGEEELYSNSGYLLLANIVRKATGKSLRQYLEERFMDPLGMAHSSIWDDNKEIVSNRATGYSPEGEGWGIDHAWNFQMGGDGQVLTSVDDLLKWENNYYDLTVGGQEYYDHMHTRGILNNADTLTYALGLDVDEYKGVKRVAHGGSWAGFRAFLARYPDHHTSVAVLCNRGNANAGSYANQVSDIILVEHLKEEESEEGDGEAETAETEIEVAEAELRGWAGMYRSADAPEYFPITYEGGVLSISAGGDAYPLSPRSESRYVIERFSVDIFLTEEDGNRVLRIGAMDEDPYFMVEQVEEDPSSMDHLVGVYSSDELSVNYEISVGPVGLMLTRPNKDATQLVSGSAGEFFTEGLGITFEDVPGRAAQFSIYAGRVTGIVFTKVEP